MSCLRNLCLLQGFGNVLLWPPLEVLGCMSRFIIHSQSNFWVWGGVEVNDHLCIHECPVALAPRKIEKTLLLPLNYLGALFTINSPHMRLCFLDPTICSYAKTPPSDYSRFIGSPKSSSENPPWAACFWNTNSFPQDLSFALVTFSQFDPDCQGEVSTIPRGRAWKKKVFLLLVLKAKSLESRDTQHES